MLWLKQSTAITVKIGPFIDDIDGKTVEPSLTISQSNVRLSINGGNIAQKNDSSACTYDESGIYDCSLNATDVGTLGRLQLWVLEVGALPVWHEYMVVPANVYDSFFSTDMLKVDIHAIDDDETAADNLESYCDGTTPQPVNTTQVEGSDATNQIRDAVVDDATRIDASALNTLSGYAPASTIAAASDIPSAADNADAVWDELEAGHLDAGKAGQQLWTDINNILTDTDAIQQDWANDGRLDLLLDAVKLVTDKLSPGAQVLLVGVVNTENTASTTTTFSATGFTETTTDHFKNRYVYFYDTGDALFGQGAEITGYEWDGVNSEGMFTVSTLTEAPSDGDLFVIY